MKKLIISRRDFLQTMVSATGVTIASPFAFAQAQPVQRLSLGFDTYSIRSLRWKAPQILDYAASLKLDVVMMSAPCFESFEEPYLQKVKD